MMSSSRIRRTKKIAERMVEIEKEVKVFHSYCGEIIKICTALVQKMKDVPDVENFMDEYTTTYRYLCNCAASFSEFNCKMEILRLGSKATPPFLQITFPIKNHSVKNTEKMEKGKSSSLESERTHLAGFTNNLASGSGNLGEKTQSHDVPSVAESVKHENSRGAQGNSEATGVKKKEVIEGATTSFSLSFERAQHIKRYKPRSQPNEMASKCSLGNEISTEESSKRSNKSAITSTLPLSADPALTGDAAISKIGGRDSPETQSSNQPSIRRNHVNVKLLETRSGNKSGFTKQESEASGKEYEKWEENMGKDLRPLKIDREVGVVHDVILSHLVSPDEFYVYVKCEELMLLEELKKKLSESSKSIEGNVKDYGEPWPSHPQTKRLAVDKMLGSHHALAFSDDTSSWTRIKILDWRMDEADDLILVFHVDHGASCLLSYRRIVPLHESLAEYPAFVQKCYMSHIVPTGEKWSEEDKTVFEIFTESTENKSHLKMEITEKEVREDGALGVKLFLPESRICLNDKLTEYGIAVTKTNEMVGGCREKWEDTRGRYLPAYIPGQTIPVKVTCILKVNHIFCVKDYDKTKEADVLQTLITYLNNPETESEMSSLEKPPNVGDLVIGKYEDGLWYRAQVVKSNPEFGVCKVKFLDYGNTETVSMKEIRKMESKYLKIPFQMVECLLEGVELKSKADQHEAVKYLHARIGEDTTINIKKVLDGARSFYSVAIFDKNGQNIASELVSAGFAVSSAGSR